MVATFTSTNLTTEIHATPMAKKFGALKHWSFYLQEMPLA
jgi:hypothetical protein